MKLSRTERWILANQAAILERLVPTDADHYRRMREALSDGYEYEYDNFAEHIYEKTLSEEECKLVIHAMSMYEALQRALPDDAAAAFPGFDGNNETAHMAYAEFFRMDHPPRFENLKLAGPDCNSHCPMRDKYRAMLAVWNSCAKPYELTPNEARAILAAK